MFYSQSAATSPLSSMLCISSVMSSTLLRLPSSVWTFKSGYNNQYGWSQPLIRCDAVSKTNTAGLSTASEELSRDEILVLKRQHEIVEDNVDRLAAQEHSSNAIKRHVERIREMFKSMENGEISISAYDTAWVALVKDVNGAPQFPSSLQWIVDNQLPDGSWGDHLLYLAHDRIINTLACVIALTSWNIYPDKIQKATAFLEDNISKLENEKAEHMPIGFEVAFPSLLEIARSHGIEFFGNSPALREIYALRSLKLKRIPMEILHKIPTTLLHSLEGMEGLDWEKLLKLQSQDGSFLFSPSSTAYALMQTKDVNCLAYLDRIVQRFNGGVPNVYPVDLFEHIWIVDRLQRLGISRHFEAEIKECMSYINRYWTERGICWARNSEVQDIDDTAMAFRLLRLHGYEVSADVFRNFEKAGEFFCFAGQSTQAVTGMFNLLRASQVKFPGETVLDEARVFSSKYLIEKQASNELFDKWIIAKDLPGEVAYALDVPWYASLPRIETRFYVEQYGGDDDVWIGKTLYRMPYVSNNIFLEMAKWEYNNCQESHRREWNTLLRWYAESNIGEFVVSQRNLLKAYFVAAATMFEPEKSTERFAWAKTSTLVEAIAIEFGDDIVSCEERRNFVNIFQSSCSLSSKHARDSESTKKEQRLVGRILNTIEQLSLDALVTYGRDIRSQLVQAWEKWLKTWENEGDIHKGEAELLVFTIELCAGRTVSEAHTFSLLDMTNEICHRLGHLRINTNTAQGIEDNRMTITELHAKIEKVTELVLSNPSDDVNVYMKQTCFAIMKTFYYAAYCSQQEIDNHIEKVLFQKVD